MKTPNDIATADMLPDGLPAFELDHTHPWSLPPVKPWVPTPRELTLKERWDQNKARVLKA